MKTMIKTFTQRIYYEGEKQIKEVLPNEFIPISDIKRADTKGFKAKDGEFYLQVFAKGYSFMSVAGLFGLLFLVALVAAIGFGIATINVIAGAAIIGIASLAELTIGIWALFNINRVETYFVKQKEFQKYVLDVDLEEQK